MKGIIATAAALVVATGMAMASKNTNEATKSSQIKIRQVEASGIYNLRYSADAPGHVTVKITNEKGNTLLKERINYEASFDRPYNLQGLPEGTYTVVVERDGSILEEVIHHVKSMPLNNAAYSVDVKELATGKYELLVKKGTQNPVSVKITDGTGIVFFDGTIDEAGSFSKVFDLSNVVASNLKMEVSMANRSVVKSL